ncbi:hypothetical protein FBR04_19385 [Betaproteobacteria bacterium PRO7]|nr:hypothetical protein [Betaproteobacteria bacterium PRO7]
MRLRRNVAVCLALTLGAFDAAVAKDDLSARGLLSIAKMAGACGILDSMINLQRTTKLPGGDDFVVRMWAVEAARLGMTVQQLSDTCNRTVEAYNRLWAAGEESPTKK